MKSLIKLIQLFSSRELFFTFLKTSVFSLSSFKILKSAKLRGINPAVIIDVGANIGQFSVMSRLFFPNATIYPIEPNPYIQSKLKKNLGYDLANRIQACGIGDSNGTMVFKLNSDSQVSSFLDLGEDRAKHFPSSHVTEKISIPVRTLDSLYWGNIPTGKLLIKIDVQGFEDKVLKGAEKLLNQTDWVIIEISFMNLYVGELV